MYKLKITWFDVIISHWMLKPILNTVLFVQGIKGDFFFWSGVCWLSKMMTSLQWLIANKRNPQNNNVCTWNTPDHVMKSQNWEFAKQNWTHHRRRPWIKLDKDRQQRLPVFLTVCRTEASCTQWACQPITIRAIYSGHDIETLHPRHSLILWLQ